MLLKLEIIIGRLFAIKKQAVINLLEVLVSHSFSLTTNIFLR